MHKILFLDDEAELVEDLPILLGGLGLNVIGTCSINEALSILESQDVEAVLLDIMMPPKGDVDAEKVDYGRNTGVWVAQRMKEIKPKVPIVALTVVWNKEMKKRMREAGISHIISKPAEIEQIAEVLLEIITETL